MRGLARAFALFTGASVVGSLTQVLKGKMSAVVLGPEGVGITSQLTSTWSLFSVAAGLGFYSGMVRHLSKRWIDGRTDDLRQHMSTSIFFLCGAAICFAFLGVIFSEDISHLVFADYGAQGKLIALILLSLPLFAVSQVYRALLNSARAVTQLVRARVATDIANVIVFGILIFSLGLKGAILGFMSLHALYLVFSFISARGVLGMHLVKPRAREFRWKEVSTNVGYGLNGLITSSLGIIVTVVVSRWIISDYDLAANGIFMVALKVTTVYLGGLYAAAGGYYFPTLISARNRDELNSQMNDALALYLYVVPPVIVILMAGGDFIIPILFSEAFLPVVSLLFVMLTGDLFRITAETLGLPLVAQRNLVTATGLYCAWAVFYLLLVWVLLPRYGLMGVATSYLISQAASALVTFVVVNFVLHYRMSLCCALSVLRGLVPVTSSAIFLLFVEAQWTGLAVCGTFLTGWLLLSLLDQEFLGLARQAVRKVLSAASARGA